MKKDARDVKNFIDGLAEVVADFGDEQLFEESELKNAEDIITEQKNIARFDSVMTKSGSVAKIGRNALVVIGLIALVALARDKFGASAVNAVLKWLAIGGGVIFIGASRVKSSMRGRLDKMREEIEKLSPRKDELDLITFYPRMKKIFGAKIGRVLEILDEPEK